MFERILVPLDGSKNAEMALPYAGAIAQKYQGEITLVGVIEKRGSPVKADNQDVLELYLAQTAQKVSEGIKAPEIKTSQRVNFKILDGDIAHNILSYSDEINANLIALTSRGISSHEKWVLGNISAKILRAAKKPILLIRSVEKDGEPEEKRLLSKILLPLDGSALGESAIPIAESLASRMNAQLILIHVLDRYVYYLDSGDPEVVDFNSREAAARAYMARVRGVIKARTDLAISAEIFVGTPAKEIADYARQHDIDLIAMSTHGRTGLQHWAFGSVTDKTLHFGDTPVLIVRPAKN